MSTPFWGSGNQETVHYALFLPYCSINIEYIHVGRTTYEDTYLTYLTNVILVLNNISFFIDLGNCKNANWNAAVRQWSCRWAGQLLMLLDGWRHSKLLYFPICIPEMTVNGKHGIRVAAFLSCFLSSNFKTVRIKQEGKKWSGYLGVGGKHFWVIFLNAFFFFFDKTWYPALLFQLFFENTESATAYPGNTESLTTHSQNQN